MALPELISTLEEDADAEIRRELHRARSEAARVARESAARIERRRVERLAAREAELRREAELAIVRAHHDARHAVLSARARMIERVFDAARAALPSVLERPELEEVLRRDLETALSLIGEDRAVVRCPAALEPMVRAIAGETSEIEIDDAVGLGVEVMSADRTLRIDQTLAARIERLRPALSIAIATRTAGDSQ